MSPTSSHKRKYLIGAVACLALAASAPGLGHLLPAYGPVAGAIVPQHYVETLTDAQIPQSGRFVLVDAASARLYMIEDGRVRDSMRVIVGKPAAATPALRSAVHHATLNPYWNVPLDLAQKLIAPRVRKSGIGYLTKRGYEVVSDFGDGPRVLSPDSVDWEAVAAGRSTVHVRQRPGPENSMGQMKFNLAYSNGIYLHDTPNKVLFAKRDRNLSNGCVRLEDAPRFARWLLGKDPPLDSTVPEQQLALPRPVPVTIAYLGASAQMQVSEQQ